MSLSGSRGIPSLKPASLWNGYMDSELYYAAMTAEVVGIPSLLNQVANVESSDKDCNAARIVAATFCQAVAVTTLPEKNRKIDAGVRSSGCNKVSG